MVMADNVYISEVLCFLLNKFGKCPIKNVKDVVLKFYDANEIVHAKEVLYGELVKLNMVGLPRLSKRQGDNRVARDIDDLFAYITKADEAGMLTMLPTFVAANLDRVPSVKPEEVDLCLLLQKMNKLEAIVCQHDEMIRRVKSQGGSQAEDHPAIPAPLTNGESAANDQLCASTDSDDVPPAAVNESWADLAAQLAQDPPGEWTPARPKKRSRLRVPIRVRGSKDVSTSAVRTIPRQDVLSAYVGRIHPDTTEEELTVFLQQEGMKGVVCRKLKPKDGKTYRTAAFYVTCCKDSVNLFYDENCWPVGVELRDWVYK
jgi:hypothetical protein